MGRCSLVSMLGAGGQRAGNTLEQVYKTVAGHTVSGLRSCSLLNLQHIAPRPGQLGQGARQNWELGPVVVERGERVLQRKQDNTPSADTAWVARF